MKTAKTLGARSRLISGERMQAAESSAIEQILSPEITDALRGHSKLYGDVEVMRLLADIDRRLPCIEDVEAEASEKAHEEGVEEGKAEGVQEAVDDYLAPLVEEVEMLIDRLSSLKLKPEDVGGLVENVEAQLKTIHGKFNL